MGFRNEWVTACENSSEWSTRKFWRVVRVGLLLRPSRTGLILHLTIVEDPPSHGLPSCMAKVHGMLLRCGFKGCLDIGVEA